MKVRRQKGTGTESFGVYRPDPELTPDFATYQQQDFGRVNLLSFLDPEMGRIIPTLARHGRLETSLSSLPPDGPFRPQTHLEAGGLGAGGAAGGSPRAPRAAGCTWAAARAARTRKETRVSRDPESVREGPRAVIEGGAGGEKESESEPPDLAGGQRQRQRQRRCTVSSGAPGARRARGAVLGAARGAAPAREVAARIEAADPRPGRAEALSEARSWGGDPSAHWRLRAVFFREEFRSEQVTNFPGRGGGVVGWGCGSGGI